VSKWALFLISCLPVASGHGGQASSRYGTNPGIIVTGMEHSGTTVTSMLIMSAPGTMGPIETGFLLAAQPADFHKVQPWYEWLTRPVELGWLGLKPKQVDTIQRQQSHLAMYNYALRVSPLLRNTTSYLDKTPGYWRDLANVMSRAPGVPVVVVRKQHPRGSTEKIARQFNLSLANALERHGTARIHQVSFEHLFEDPCKQAATARGLFRFLGLPFNMSWFDGREVARKRPKTNALLNIQLHGGFGSKLLDHTACNSTS